MMSRHQPITVRVAIAVLVVAAVGISTQAQADEREPIFSGDEVVVYPQGEAPEWTKTRREIVLGERGPGGSCSVTLELYLAPDESAIAARELAFDPKNCRSLVEFGVPGSTSDAGVRPGMVRQTFDLLPAPSRRAPAPEPVQTDSVHTSAGQFYVKIEDPPEWNVDSVRQTLEWDWDGSNAVLGSASVDLDYLTLTGWFINQHNSWADDAGSYAIVHTQAEFKNWLFCVPFLSTTTKHWPQYMHGWSDGGLSANVTRQKSGDCADLLSFPAVELTRLY